MKALFLTSNLGCYINTNEGKKVVNCDNTNYFIDRLRVYAKRIPTLVFIASDPDNYVKTDEYVNVLVKSLNLDSFCIQKVYVIDHRFDGNLADVINNAQVVFLAGGHILTQNKYFKEIGLKSILEKYEGVVIGKSAGSINCAEVAYIQPETEEEFRDPNYMKLHSGLGLTKIKVMPHMNRATTDSIDGVTTLDMCLADSNSIPQIGIYDGGFIEVSGGVSIAYGKTLSIKNGKSEVLCEVKETAIIWDNLLKI